LEVIYRGLLEVLPWHLLGETEESHQNLGITGIPVEIRTEHPTNTRLERYRYTTTLCLITQIISEKTVRMLCVGACEIVPSWISVVFTLFWVTTSCSYVGVHQLLGKPHVSMVEE
jgi:hypothetical protein